MRLGITATREGLTPPQQQRLYERISDPDVTEVHHGDCVGGDAVAHVIAIALGKRVVIHPSTIEQLRAHCERFVNADSDVEVRDPKPPLTRNHHIVDETGALLALPAQEVEIVRSGTWTTVRYARRVGKKLPARYRYVVVLPSGEETR